MLLVYIVKAGENLGNYIGKQKSTKKEDVLAFDIFRKGQPDGDDNSMMFYFNRIAT